MNPHESTAANADIWARYFEQQWTRWLPPLGERSPVSEIAGGTAANVASWLTLVAAAPIAWLFSANAPAVDEAIAVELTPVPAEAEAGAREIAA